MRNVVEDDRKTAVCARDLTPRAPCYRPALRRALTDCSDTRADPRCQHHLAHPLARLAPSMSTSGTMTAHVQRPQDPILLVLFKSNPACGIHECSERGVTGENLVCACMARYPDYHRRTGSASA